MPDGVGIDAILAAELFDAAIDESRWPELLERVNRSLGARSSAVVSTNLADSSGSVAQWVSPAITPEIQRAYNDRYSRYEADGYPVLKDSRRFEILSEHDMWPNDPDLRRRPDFVAMRELLGIDSRMIARVNEDRAWFSSFVVHFAVGRDAPTEVERSVFSFYLPFIAQVVKLSNVFSRLKARFQAALIALDRYAVPVAVVDGQGRVVLRNASADGLIARDSGVAVSESGRLRLSDWDADARLRAAIAAASLTAIGEGAAAETVLTARKPGSVDPLGLEISPLRDADRELERGFTGALVKIYDPSFHSVRRIDAFATIYGLTDAEMSVARLLVNGAEQGEIADIRGTSPQTVRTQIKAILQKTGCKTRTDLVRRALSAHLPIDAGGPDCTPAG
jgi:DNA-binding CsgD family transcriptional regulator